MLIKIKISNLIFILSFDFKQNLLFNLVHISNYMVHAIHVGISQTTYISVQNIPVYLSRHVNRERAIVVFSNDRINSQQTRNYYT